MEEIAPSFDTKIDVVSFELQTPLNYVVQTQDVHYTPNGVFYKNQTQADDSSDSSSDEEFVLSKRKKKSKSSK